jgi:peptide/nickel transport system substrate-binding protein
MSLKRRVAVVLVVALSVALATFTGVAQGQAVKNPDTLVVQTIGGPETLDPTLAYDNDSTGAFQWNIYESLIFFRGVRTDLYDPMLATEVPSVTNGGISAGGKTYTFKIRQGVKFHDGSVMTPDDVKYSLMRFMLVDADGGPAWILLASILGFDTQSTRDDNGKLLPDIWDRVNNAIQVRGNTVVITQKDPYAPFLNILGSWSMVVSKKFVVQNGGWDGAKDTLPKYNNPKPEDLTLRDKADGTGPFKLENYDKATETVTLVRNDNYWRAPAKFRRVVIQKVEEFATRRLALQNGDADIIGVSRADQPAVMGLPGVRVVDDLGTLQTSPGLFMSFSINGEGNPDVGSGKLDGNGIPPNFFSDVHVRRAIAYALDLNAVVAAAYRGKGRPGNGPIPFGMLGYNPRGKWYEASKDKAIAEFKEAWGGQVWANGFKFSVFYNSGNTGRQIASEILKESLESLNPKFKVDVRGVTWSTYQATQRAKKAPIYYVGWLADYADPDNFVTPFMHSTGFFAKRQGYKNPEADKLIEAAAKETDAKKREQLYFRLQEIAYQDVPALYVLYPVDLAVMRSWVKGWYYNPIFPEGNLFGYLYNLSKGQ